MRAVIVRQGNKYGEEYTSLLKRQFAKQGIDAFVLGDGPDADIPLSYGYEGWWAKLELFSPGLKFLRPFWYVDLDSFILGKIPDLVSDEFLICREWHPVCYKTTSECQSSMMYVPRETDHIWNAIDESTTKTKGGDQAWLCQFADGFIQDLYPYLVGSYKFHNKDRPHHHVVTFHGKPKPKDAEGWPREIWKAYSI